LAAEADWLETARSLFGAADHATLLACHDSAARTHQLAAFDGDRLVGALYLAPDPVGVSRSWAAQQLGRSHADAAARFAVLAGRPADARLDPGATVCSCYSVGVNQIVAAIAKGCTDVIRVGEATQAGTNCGSCRSEIGAIIQRGRRHERAVEAPLPVAALGV